MPSFPIQSEVSLCVCVCGECVGVYVCSVMSDPQEYCSPPVSSVHGIILARIWSWLPFLSPGDLPNPGTEPEFPSILCIGRRFFTTEPPGKLVYIIPNVELLENCYELLTRAVSLVPVFSCLFS